MMHETVLAERKRCSMCGDLLEGGVGFLLRYREGDKIVCPPCYKIARVPVGPLTPLRPHKKRGKKGRRR